MSARAYHRFGILLKVRAAVVCKKCFWPDDRNIHLQKLISKYHSQVPFLSCCPANNDKSIIIFVGFVVC